MGGCLSKKNVDFQESVSVLFLNHQRDGSSLHCCSCELGLQHGLWLYIFVYQLC